MNYEVDIVDARSFEIVGKSFFHIKDGGTVVDSFSDFTGWLLAAKDDFKFNAFQQDRLHRDLIGATNRSIIECLRSLELGLSLPDPRGRMFLPVPAEENGLSEYQECRRRLAARRSNRSSNIMARGSSQASGSFDAGDWKLDAAVRECGARRCWPSALP